MNNNLSCLQILGISEESEIVLQGSSSEQNTSLCINSNSSIFSSSFHPKRSKRFYYFWR
jgi:hypothetical protein